MLLAGGIVLALALVTGTDGLSEPVAARAVHGGTYTGSAAGVREASSPTRLLTQRHPGVKARSAIQEWAAVIGASHTSQMGHQVAAARGRARFQPDAWSLIRLVRERQDAIIMAFAHRMRGSSEPGSVRHTSDRQLIVTRPLRGPPARA